MPYNVHQAAPSCDRRFLIPERDQSPGSAGPGSARATHGPGLLPKCHECQSQHPSPGPELLPTMPGVPVRVSIPRSASHSIPRGQDCSPRRQECQSEHPSPGAEPLPRWQLSTDVRHGAHLHSNRCSGSAAAQGEQQRQGCSGGSCLLPSSCSWQGQPELLSSI